MPPPPAPARVPAPAGDPPAVMALQEEPAFEESSFRLPSKIPVSRPLRNTFSAVARASTMLKEAAHSKSPTRPSLSPERARPERRPRPQLDVQALRIALRAARYALADRGEQIAVRDVARRYFWVWWHGAAAMAQRRAAIAERLVMSRAPSVLMRARQLQNVMVEGTTDDLGEAAAARLALAPRTGPLSPGSYMRRGLVASSAPRSAPSSSAQPKRSVSPAAFRTVSTSPPAVIEATFHRPIASSVTEALLSTGSIVSPPTGGGRTMLDRSPMMYPGHSSTLFSPPSAETSPRHEAQLYGGVASSIDRSGREVFVGTTTLLPSVPTSGSRLYGDSDFTL